MRVPRCYLALAALAATALFAQAQTDYSKIQIKSNKLADNLYTLDGAGGTIGVLTGPEGVFMVDSQFAPLSEKIAAAIKQISGGQPIRFLINTHVHGDHTGGNENLGKMGVTIFAREQLRERLIHPAPAANGTVPASAPEGALPLVTYSGPVSFHMNGEEVRLIPIPRAHTDGDTLVRFVNADAIMSGDFYRSVQFPNIDRANGGSLNGMLDGLAYIIGQAGPTTKIIPGHGPTVDRNAVMAHRDMILAIRDRVAKLVDQGQTVEQVVAAKPAADYDGKVQEAGTSRDRFVGQLYAELKTK